MSRRSPDGSLGLPSPPVPLLLLLLLAAVVPPGLAGEQRAPRAARAGGAGRVPGRPRAPRWPAPLGELQSPVKFTSRGCVRLASGWAPRNALLPGLLQPCWSSGMAPDEGIGCVLLRT